MTGTEIVAWLVMAFPMDPIACFKRRSIGFPRGPRGGERMGVPSIHNKRGATLYCGPTLDGSRLEFPPAHGRCLTGGGAQWPL